MHAAVYDLSVDQRFAAALGVRRGWRLAAGETLAYECERTGTVMWLDPADERRLLYTNQDRDGAFDPAASHEPDFAHMDAALSETDRRVHALLAATQGLTDTARWAAGEADRYAEQVTSAEPFPWEFGQPVHSSFLTRIRLPAGRQTLPGR